MTNDPNGFLILLRAVLSVLLEQSKGQKCASLSDVYFYLLYHANFSNDPRIRAKSISKVVELKGQTAASAEDLAKHFGVRRNTITARLQKLENYGFIKKNKNANLCNVYELVNYGEIDGFFVQKVLSNRKTIDYTKGESEFCNSGLSNRLSNRIEQPFEQPQTQFFEQPQSIDIYSENGNFSQPIEQPQKETTFAPKTANAEQLNINNYINNINSLSPTREQDENFYLRMQNDLATQTQWRDDVIRALGIQDVKAVESLLREFKNEQFAKTNYHSSLSDARSHFLSWCKIQLQKSNFSSNGKTKQFNDDRSGSRGAYEPTGNENYFESF